MPPRLPPDLLQRSAEESSRLLALLYLDQIDRAQRRLAGGGDPEALHDFRVGLRRLRSAVRAYRAELKGSLTGAARAQLRKLTRATNAGRDTEVQLTWLRERAANVATTEDAPGLFWFTGRLEGRKHDAIDRATASAVRTYLKAAGKLRRKLGILRIEVGPNPGKPATFGQVTGDLIRQQVVQVRDRVKRLRDVTQVDDAHKTRITIKRLRYLLEPVARHDRRARALIPRLKEAQDLLGKHHDMHVLSEEIAAARVGLPSNGASGLSGLERGLATLERMAAEDAAASFERFHSLWSGGREEQVLGRANEVGRLLVEGPTPVEPSPVISPPSPPALEGPALSATAVT